MRVSLFATCLADTFYPRTAIAVVKVLEHLGCEVEFPAEQTCCGQPMYNNGFHAEARELARRMVRVFEGSEYVVTPSGSCAAMVHDYYGELLGDDSAYRRGVSELIGKTYEFVQFLVHVLTIDPRKLKVRWRGKVTYHYSCHLRGIGVTDEAIRLLAAIEGVEYVPLEKMDQCCGFGGTFAVKYPTISGAMVRDKVECIRATRAHTVVCNAVGCTMNIAGACRRAGVNVTFKSRAEILAAGLGLMARVATIVPVPEEEGAAQ